MKDFFRENPLFSLCGLNCGLCTMRMGGYCPGCGGGDGNQSCAIARCAAGRGISDYCFGCGEYPCAKYEGFDRYDSFVIGRTRARDIERYRALGEPAYMAELNSKMAALDILLENFNDGRKKSFFVAAVSLLGLSDINGAMESISAIPDGLPIKEKAALAVEAFQAAAGQRGVKVKFERKPRKKKD